MTVKLEKGGPDMTVKLEKGGPDMSVKLEKDKDKKKKKHKDESPTGVIAKEAKRMLLATPPPGTLQCIAHACVAQFGFSLERCGCVGVVLFVQCYARRLLIQTAPVEKLAKPFL